MLNKQPFQDVKFLIIEEDGHVSSAQELDKIKSLIASGGGTYVTAFASESLNLIEKYRVGHVLTSTYNFSGNSEAAELLVPVTNNQWLVDSAQENQKKNYRLYLPDPKPYMAGVVLCIANNLPQSDKDLMYTAVRLFGGQYLDLLSRYTTHLIVEDKVNSKAVVATHVNRKQNFEIKFVLPAWILECMRQKWHVSEKPYLLSDLEELDSGLLNYEDNKQNQQPVKFSRVLFKKRVYLSTDFNLSAALVECLETLVESHGGMVESTSTEALDIYVGKYRTGERFKRCCAREDVHVGLISWLFHVVATGRYVAPLESNLLFFPIPSSPLTQFQNLKISVTGINGDARHYLTLLITTMGAVFTKTLDATNDYLVCGTATSEKYLAARTRWPTVKAVNFLWIEDCYAQWKFLNPLDSRYTSMRFDSAILGKARFPSDFPQSWIDTKLDVSGFEDSADYESTEDLGIPTEEAMDRTQGPKEKCNPSFEFNKLENGISLQVEEDQKLEKQHISDKEVQEVQSQKAGSIEKEEKIENSKKLEKSSKIGESAEPAATVYSDSVVVVNDIPSSPIYERASRTAKQKASLKLHSDMEDLNKYVSISKSSRKMKDYMAQLELAVAKTPSKKRINSQSDPVLTELEMVKRKSPAPKKKKNDAVRYIAIITGCENIIVPTRADVVKLAHVGIILAYDFDTSKKPIDTIVAPKILRTEKFLKSLSQAERIVHPTYLMTLLSQMEKTPQMGEEELYTLINIDNFSLDKVLSEKQVNEELGYTSPGNGLANLLSSKKLKEKMASFKLNLSSNLNGGAPLIESILMAHSLSESQIVKLSSNTKKSDLVSLENGDTIVVVHRQKDAKFKAKGVTTVDWNWCVKCLFQGEIVPYKTYSPLDESLR